MVHTFNASIQEEKAGESEFMICLIYVAGAKPTRVT